MYSCIRSVNNASFNALNERTTAAAAAAAAAAASSYYVLLI